MKWILNEKLIPVEITDNVSALYIYTHYAHVTVLVEIFYILYSL